MSTQNNLSAAVRAALTRFESTLSPDELAGMKISTLDDVHDSMRKIQEKQGSEKKLRNLNRMKVFLEGMRQYEQLVKVFLNVSSVVAFVWVCEASGELLREDNLRWQRYADGIFAKGPIKFLLLVSNPWQSLSHMGRAPLTKAIIRFRLQALGPMHLTVCSTHTSVSATSSRSLKHTKTSLAATAECESCWTGSSSTYWSFTAGRSCSSGSGVSAYHTLLYAQSSAHESYDS
jgi:hypothetical protein